MNLKIDYPGELPVCAHRAEILDAVRRHPVVIVCGDTGSGKTTQLPKMMLELGRARGSRRIAVTQPRRLAAVTMAERVADELRIGGADGEFAAHESIVGYRHRYARNVTSATRIEFMTDGILLAETKFDPLLRAYDTIIVDEAHERTLNVDFLLGILRRILERRNDLKVVISSATMDTEKFAEFFTFQTSSGPAVPPVINVPGRLFPIETRYMFGPDDDTDDSVELPQAVARAVEELPESGDILVFLAGERDIRETAEFLSDTRGGRDDIIPLLASLPASEQRRAFMPSSRRRIILATNVAETSVTIPGIRAVIDSGLVRLSRYVHRTQIQRLQIEPTSQASARQRAGRCGRLGPGICIRLYSEEDFLRRDAYTPPEILRSSLAGVILTMLDLKLGAIETFPFIDPPKPTMVREGLRELLELGAIKSGYVLTDIGRKLSRIPVEPRLARILVAASENAALPGVLPVVAAMACDDPRRRPIDERERAAQAHAQWRVAGSDFLSTLKLWQWWKTESAELSQSRARKLAKANYLAFPKLREWCELVRQLETLSKRLGLSFTEASDDEARTAAFHRSLLSGLLGRIGHWHTEDREYRGAHGLRFSVHPGSVLTKTLKRDKRQESVARKSPSDGQTGKSRGFPEWIVAGELVDTGRLLARTAAAIDVRWIEPIAGEICKHHVHSPTWDESSGFVRATERVTLYGLPIVESRRCDYSRFDPDGARDIFIRHGMVGCEFPRPTPIIRDTLGMIRRLRERAEKARRPELFDEGRLMAHFNAAIPSDVTSANALKRHLSRATKDELRRFRLDPKEWKCDNCQDDTEFPDELLIGAERIRLSYRNCPEDPATDGITCTVGENQLAALSQWRDDWLVPGLLRIKVSYLLRCLPNSIQRLLKPLDDAIVIINDILAACPPDANGQPSMPLEKAIRKSIEERWAFRIPKDSWTNVRMPAYLKVRFVVRDAKSGRVISDSREKPSPPTPPPPTPPPKTSEVKLDPLTRKLVKELLTDERRIDILLGTGAYPETTVDAVLEQLAWLTFEGFPALVPHEILLRYPRYFKGIDIRLARAKVSPSSDRAKEARFAPHWQRYREAAKNRANFKAAELQRYRWMLEDYRLQLFAPELRTFETVSPERLDAAWNAAVDD